MARVVKVRRANARTGFQREALAQTEHLPSIRRMSLGSGENPPNKQQAAACAHGSAHHNICWKVVASYYAQAAGHGC